MSKLDQSLSDIIKSNKPVRTARSNNRKTPYKNKSKGAGIGRRVYVGNLTWQTKWQDLKDVMRKAGPVNHVNILEYEDGKSKGCAIVEFETVKGAKNAIATLHDTDVDGRPIFVREDREVQHQRGNFNFGGGRGAAYDEPVFSPNSNMAQKIRNNAPAGCCVYVGNLPWSAQWQELKDICAKFGSVGRADVEQDQNGRSKGFGIAVFDNEEDAANCVRELDGATFGDRELTVKLDKIKAKGQTYDRRGRGGGRYGTGSYGGYGGGASTKVFIGNLPWSVQWQDLKDLCKQYGNVGHADIPQLADGKSKGFGIVRFESQRDARNCVNNLNGMLLDGRELNVRFDREA